MQVGADLEAVHYYIDAVLLLLVQLGQFVEFVELAVDAGPNEALGTQFVEHCQVLALALTDHRCQQHQLAAFRALQDQVDHLADGLRLQRNVVVRAARSTHASIKQA